MENLYTDYSIPTKISEKRIYDIYCDNYDSIHYLFVEFQFSWLQQAYNALKDLDKYNILVYLYKENFVELNELFKVKSLKGFGCEDLKDGIVSAGAILYHITESLNGSIDHISKIQEISNDGIMGLDSFTVRNLEIFNS